MGPLLLNRTLSDAQRGLKKQKCFAQFSALLQIVKAGIHADLTHCFGQLGNFFYLDQGSRSWQRKFSVRPYGFKKTERQALPFYRQVPLSVGEKAKLASPTLHAALSITEKIPVLEERRVEESGGASVGILFNSMQGA